MGARRKTCVMMCVFSFLGLGVAGSTTNHSSGVLPRVHLSCSIVEGVPSGTPIVDLRENATTRSGNDEPPSFSISSSQHRELFTISGSVLTTKDPVDREVLCPRDPVCVLRVDIGVFTSGNFETLKVEVEVIDVNDNSPSFRHPSVNRSIEESATPGFFFQILPAHDPDASLNSEIVYRLEPDGSPFRLVVQDASVGSQVPDLRLELTRVLDREAESGYELQLLATDRGVPPRVGRMFIYIEVADANDNSPVFDQRSYDATIDPAASAGTLLTTVHATDKDEGLNGQVRYHLTRKSQLVYGQLFSVDPVSGEIRTKARIEPGPRDTYHLQIVAQDQGDNPVPAVANVVMVLQSTNDHFPELSISALKGNETTAEIPENSLPGTFLAHLKVHDPDLGKNGQTVCGTNSREFTVEPLRPNEYKIQAAVTFDREQRDRYDLKVTCSDLGTPSLTGSLDFVVLVTDLDDNVPVFSKSTYEVSVAENNEKGSFLVQVEAVDPDAGRQFEYALERDAENWFQVDGETGVITAQVLFDREFVNEFVFHVIARCLKSDDEDNCVTSGDSRLLPRARVHVTVTDVDDEPPRFTQSWYRFDVVENENSGTEVGQVQALDDDLPPFDRFSYQLEYSPEGGSNHFAVDPVSGILYTRRTLDREVLSHYTLRIRVQSDSKPAFSDVTVVFIRVSDVNDNAPVFTFPSAEADVISLPRNLSYGVALTSLRAFDRDLDRNADVTFSIPDGRHAAVFHLDRKSGRIIWNSDVPPRSSKVCFTNLVVRATDNGLPVSLSTTGELKLLCDDLDDPEGGLGDRGDVGLNRDDSMGGGGSGGLSGLQFLILTSVLAFCVVVVVILIAAICVTRDKSKNQKRKRKALQAEQALAAQHQEELLRIQPESEEHQDVGKESTFVMLGCQKLNVDGEGDTLVLTVRKADPHCHHHFELQRLAPTGSSRDRDTDSGCVDVSPV